ncbi:maleylpyruvate isomerase family mycothiol-dependent enzyme [Nonomuraea purpurea]|uniref:Maleylpyruvate isomerase family mycothiol-dependent enzyme n=1 Tax=Nonomuraea purpurea TaxID=1849276 RepID=A0ABV8GCC5_9ACTN
MDSLRYLELLDRDHERLRWAATRDLAAAVPSCPGWTVADLLYHVGEVYLHKAEIMRRGTWPEPWPPEPDPAHPVRFAEHAFGQLRAEFDARKPQDEAVTFYDDDQSVGYWIRRMAQETVIHRVDAELAAGEPVAPIPDDLAVDGIDEVLLIFLGYGSGKWPEEFGDALTAADGRAVAIESGAERWLVRPTRERVEVAKGDTAPAEATVEGTPQEVLLWLWRRSDGKSLTFGGDPELVERLRGMLWAATQ